MPDVRDRTWPLVAFTVAVQAAAGLALGAVCIDMLADGAVVNARFPVGIMVLGLAAAGGASSLFHLGRKPRAWRTLVNLRRSPLSREVLATLLFTGAAAASVVVWLAEGVSARLAWDGTTAVLGLAAVAAAIPVYMVPARPVWNSWWVTASFFGTMLLLGGSAASALLIGRGGQSIVDAMLGAATVGAALQALSAGAMAGRFSREWTRASTEGLEGPAMGWTPSRRLWLGCQIVLAGAAPIALAAAWWTMRAGGAPEWGPALAVAIVVSALAGIVQGRRLMFDLGASMPRF